MPILVQIFWLQTSVFFGSSFQPISLSHVSNTWAPIWAARASWRLCGTCWEMQTRQCPGSGFW